MTDPGEYRPQAQCHPPPAARPASRPCRDRAAAFSSAWRASNSLSPRLVLEGLARLLLKIPQHLFDAGPRLRARPRACPGRAARIRCSASCRPDSPRSTAPCRCPAPRTNSSGSRSSVGASADASPLPRLRISKPRNAPRTCRVRSSRHDSTAYVSAVGRFLARALAGIDPVADLHGELFVGMCASRVAMSASTPRQSCSCLP